MYGPLGFWLGIWLSSTLPQIAFALVKSSLLLQYYGLFSSTGWLRISLRIGLGFTVLFYLGSTITLIILQTPWPGGPLSGLAGSDRIEKCKAMFLPTGIIAVLIDWYILLLPIPVVVALRLSTSKKLGVLAIFMTGSLACIASMVSLYYRTTIDAILRDRTWWTVPVLNWM